MLRSRYRIFESDQPHFMTCTVCGWQPVFTRTETVNIIFDFWRYLAANDSFKLFGYVILENHLHLIASAPDLDDVMKRFKMFTARNILDLLISRNTNVLLQNLKFNKCNHKIESEYQFWEEGNHPQQIVSDEMMIQKLEYIHHNPVERGYVDLPEHWRYSSARSYLEQPALMEVVTDWR
jgi:putative transposase